MKLCTFALCKLGLRTRVNLHNHIRLRLGAPLGYITVLKSPWVSWVWRVILSELLLGFQLYVNKATTLHRKPSQSLWKYTWAFRLVILRLLSQTMLLLSPTVSVKWISCCDRIRGVYIVLLDWIGVIVWPPFFVVCLVLMPHWQRPTYIRWKTGVCPGAFSSIINCLDVGSCF